MPLKELIPRMQNKLVKIDPLWVISMTADYFNISVSNLTSKKRIRRYVMARHVSIWLIRNTTDLILSDIGKYFSSDHTTVIHALKKVNNYKGIYSDIRIDIEYLHSKILSYNS